jgi:hypothetical protein
MNILFSAANGRDQFAACSGDVAEQEQRLVDNVGIYSIHQKCSRRGDVCTKRMFIDNYPLHVRKADLGPSHNFYHFRQRASSPKPNFWSHSFLRPISKAWRSTAWPTPPTVCTSTSPSASSQVNVLAIFAADSHALLALATLAREALFTRSRPWWTSALPNTAN